MVRAEATSFPMDENYTPSTDEGMPVVSTQFYGGVDDGKTNLSIILSDTYLNGWYEPFVSKTAWHISSLTNGLCMYMYLYV